MKNLLHIALILPSVALAQPTIQNMENYSVGTVLKFKQVNPTTAGHGSGGASQTWDFSSMQKVDSFSMDVINKNATQFGSQFPDATYALKYSDGRYDFIKSTSTQGNNLGSVDSASSETIMYTNPFVNALRPVTYNTALTDTYVVSSSSATGKGTVAITGDGYGTLKTPAGTFTNVLRVRSVINEKDTITIAPIPIVITTVAVQYRWYDNSHKAPIMTWDSTHISSQLFDTTQVSANYLSYETGATGIGDRKITTIDFSASLEHGTITIHGGIESHKEYSLQLIDLSGRVIYDTKIFATGAQWSGNIGSEPAPGIYALRLTETAAPDHIGVAKLLQQ